MRKDKVMVSRAAAIRRKNAPYYLLLLPFATLFFVFTVLPVASSIVLSFFDFDMINFPKFIGIENYTRMFVDDETFGIVVKNTINPLRPIIRLFDSKEYVNLNTDVSYLNVTISPNTVVERNFQS